LMDDFKAFVSDTVMHLDRVAFAHSLGIVPDPWQERLLRTSSKRIIMACSRQSGKSTMSAIIALHRALYYPGSLVLCLAPALRQSQELFTKIAGFYRDLGRPVKAQGERKLSLELENDSRIITLPGSEKTIRGFSGVDLLIVDEAARVEDGLFYAVRPMLAVSDGALMMLSTPYGRQGVFYEVWSKAQGWDRYEVPASATPRITAEFLEEERTSLPSWAYRQEYEVSFEQELGQIFTDEMIDSAIDEDLSTPIPSSERERIMAIASGIRGRG
jgi:hypothetical protein